MKKHIITSLLLILTTPAFAAPGSSGAMNTTGYTQNNACPANNGCKDTSPSCPLKKQIKLAGNQKFDDDEFLYATEKVYNALQATYKKRPGACRMCFDVPDNSVYECDNDYCKDNKLVILEAGHVFKGKKIDKTRAYECSINANDKWVPNYNEKIECCDPNYKYYKDIPEYKDKYRYKSLANAFEICEICSNSTTTATDGKTNTGSTPAKTGTSTQKTTPVQTSPQAGDSCTMANAKTAKYKKVGNDLKCIAIECNTNYYLVENSNIQQKDGTCVAKTYCGENKELKIIAGNKTDLTCTDKQVTNSDNDTPDSSSETPVNTSNDPKVGDTCSSNGAQTATYKKIGNEIKCVASTCKSNFYLVVNANGNSQGWCTAKISCPENKEMKIIDGTKTDRTCVDKVATTPDNEETTIEETVITPDNEEETVITPDNEDGTIATECTPDSTNPECDCPDDKIREVDNTCVDETALYKQAKAEMMNRHTQLTTQTEQLNNSEAQ